MITLGLASNYSFGRSLRHLFAMGTKKDSAKLVSALADSYQSTPDQIALYHSGRTAISATLQALIGQGKILRGASVIIPGLTCIAVVRGIKSAGLKPDFCDISPENLEYDYSTLEPLLMVLSAAAATNTKKHTADYVGCILVQNTLGITWDIAKIEQLAKKYHFLIIEDLAHSAGRTYPDGRLAGTVGDATILSFGKGKAVDTICGGAAILRGRSAANWLIRPIRQPRLAERLRDRWYPVIAGLSRATWRIGLGKFLLAAAMKLHFIERSGDTALDLNVGLTNWQARLALKQIQNLATIKPGPLREFALVRDRDKCLAELSKAGYKLDEIWYDTPVAPARAAGEADFPADHCPRTVEIAQQIVNLPTWYPAKKLAKAREIIAKYSVKEAK